MAEIGYTVSASFVERPDLARAADTLQVHPNAAPIGYSGLG